MRLRSVSLGSLSTRSPTSSRAKRNSYSFCRLSQFRAGAEPAAEPQRRIGCDRALTVDDPSDPRQFGGGNAELLQLFGKMLAGVNRGAS